MSSPICALTHTLTTLLSQTLFLLSLSTHDKAAGVGSTASGRAEIGARELVLSLRLRPEAWRPQLHVLTCLTRPRVTVRGSGGQNLPSTGCLSLFQFYNFIL